MTSPCRKSTKVDPSLVNTQDQSSICQRSVGKWILLTFLCTLQKLAAVMPCTNRVANFHLFCSGWRRSSQRNSTRWQVGYFWNSFYPLPVPLFFPFLCSRASLPVSLTHWPFPSPYFGFPVLTSIYIKTSSVTTPTSHSYIHTIIQIDR